MSYTGTPSTNERKHTVIIIIFVDSFRDSVSVYGVRCTCCPVQRAQQRKTDSNFISEIRCFLISGVLVLRVLFFAHTPHATLFLSFFSASASASASTVFCMYMCVCVTNVYSYIGHGIVLVGGGATAALLATLEQHGNDRESSTENLE